MSENPFDELDEAISNVVEEKVCEAMQDNMPKTRSKYYVVDVKFVAESLKELREFLENNDDIADSSRIVKGSEMIPKRKSIYTF